MKSPKSNQSKSFGHFGLVSLCCHFAKEFWSVAFSLFLVERSQGYSRIAMIKRIKEFPEQRNPRRRRLQSHLSTGIRTFLCTLLSV